MPLTKSVGNMYPWVTHVHTHLGGECPHQCKYCYVGTGRWGRPPRYTGELRLLEQELRVDYGTGKTIFIEHMNDGFAEDVPQNFIDAILKHCNQFLDNTYVFQSKNPKRILNNKDSLPPKIMIGTTIETNRSLDSISKAPSPEQRYAAMLDIKDLLPNAETFVTVEPIMKFDFDRLLTMLYTINPTFINIGADSKHCDLPEPNNDEIQTLINAIQKLGLAIKIKHNLNRFLKEA